MNSKSLLGDLMSTDMLSYTYNSSVKVVASHPDTIRSNGENVLVVLVGNQARSDCVTIAPYSSNVFPIGVLV